jgi:membrane protein required for beta-lactamase induction
MDSSSDICILWLELVKEYNSQVRFGTWVVDVDLLNLVKSQIYNFSPLSFILSILIILLVIMFNWIKSALFFSINGRSIHVC